MDTGTSGKDADVDRTQDSWTGTEREGSGDRDAGADCMQPTMAEVSMLSERFAPLVLEADRTGCGLCPAHLGSGTGLATGCHRRRLRPTQECGCTWWSTGLRVRMCGTGSGVAVRDCGTGDSDMTGLAAAHSGGSTAVQTGTSQDEGTGQDRTGTGKGTGTGRAPPA